MWISSEDCITDLGSFTNTDKVMQFVVSDTVSDSSNNGAVPSTLNPSVSWPKKRTTVDHVFRFEHGGEDSWTINGVDFNDVNNRVLAKPQQVCLPHHDHPDRDRNGY